MSSSQPSPLAGTMQRACDQCNARKIRCDKGQPCSHCRAAGLSCRTTLQRPKQHRDRVMVSKQYENKIDRIEARLANIERLLHERLPVTSQVAATPAQPEASTESVIEVDGYTGPHADSLAAKEAFEQVAGAEPVIASDQSLSSALSSLRGIIDRIKGDDQAHTSKESNATDLPLPPWEAVRPMLNGTKGKSISRRYSVPFVEIFFPVLNVANFHDKCIKLYESDQDAPIFDRLLVYGALSSLCSEMSGITSGEESERYHYYSRSFSQHVLKTINVMPAIMTASCEGIEALLTAAFTCLEMSKPQLSLTLTSIAARFCQTLGYNRLAPTAAPNDSDRQRKILLFWQVYIYDRATALRVGRPPSIPDYDVSTEPLNDPSRFPDYLPMSMHLHRYWAEVSDVQGAINTKLYSSAGLQQTLEQRSRLVKALSAKLQAAWSRRREMNDAIDQMFAELDSKHSLTAQCVRVGDEIALYGNLTLVLHALSPPGKPTPDTIEAARACLRAYKTISSSEIDNVYTWSGFCHCVTLYSPLTPFTVLFTHVINDHKNGHVDMQLLNDFVQSLKPARQVSETIDRFYSLCSMFYQIAEAYISAKSQEAVMSEFDDYLSTLGLLPQPAGFDAAYPMQGNGGMLPSNYQDWYSGNVSLYGLIEDESTIGNFDQNFGLQVAQ